jgi:hypothetical protein
MSDDTWEYHEEALGTPDSEEALERSRQLVAVGWEFMGVRIGQGLWLYRRRVRPKDSTDPELDHSTRSAN